MVMGFVVGNFSRKREQIFRELLLIEKILFVAFLILLGATLDFGDKRVFAVAGVYVVLRMMLRYAATGGVMDSKLPERSPLGRWSGVVFTAQGGIALAIALDYALAFESEIAHFTLAVVAIAVMVNDVAAVGLTRRVLARAGEVITPPGRKGKHGA
jgi:hypothetical protein